MRALLSVYDKTGIVDLGRGLHDLGWELVSSSNTDWIERHLQRLERSNGWDAIVAANGDVARAKPQPDWVAPLNITRVGGW